MFRLSPRRSHRSQGFKVKHALQLFLLVCVSIWLLYQVRHSREKKAEFEEAARVAKESIKLGRKDLLPRTRMDDTIIRDVSHKEDDEDHKIIDHPKPQGTLNTDISTGTGVGVGGAMPHGLESQRVVQRETDRRWDPLYTKQHMEDRKEDTRGKEDEETEENKDEEESKEHDNVETESEENKETEENTNEGKESGEENEGEESTETENEDKGTDENEGKSDGIDAHDEAAREMHYKGDDASSAVSHESLNATELENSDMGENKAHEFVRWSNTNSTEAYIHQEERARNMRETETDDHIVSSDGVQGNNSTTMDEESDGERNVAELDSSHPFSTIAKDINELQQPNNNSSPQNLTATASSNSTEDNSTHKVFPYKSNLSASGQVLNSTYSSGKFRATMFRRQRAKSDASAKNQDNSGAEGAQESDLSSNTSAGAGQKEHVDSSVSEEKDETSSNGDDVNENTSADDVQKLKEIVDYSSVSRKKDESSDENTRFYNTNDSTETSQGEAHSQEDMEALSTANSGTNDSSLDTSIPQEEKDARTDLETLPGSLTAGGNRGEEAAAE